MEQGDELDNKKEEEWPKEKYEHHHHHNKNKKLNQLMSKVVNKKTMSTLNTQLTLLAP
jgi:hypothetical protein